MRVIITGAAGALGRSVFSGFETAGHRVACIDRVEGEAGEHRRWFLADDLSDAEWAAAAVDAAAAWLGGIDALVHLVGAFDWKLVEQSQIEDWRALYSANVETAYQTIYAALAHLGEGAAIVTIGAASAEPAAAGMAPYAAAKAGVARLTEALAEELRPRAIRVNAVLPSIIDTPRNRSDMPDADFKNWVGPEAIADVILFLASPASRAVNGARIPVTNGASA